MAPSKKREKENSASATSSSNNGSNGANAPQTNGTSSESKSAEISKLNGHQQEQELFLQAFEKPTQIYRFLRDRHDTSPIFLNRTLCYMKDRMSRNNKKRNNFKVNSILDLVTQKTELISNNYLNIIYNGLLDKTANSDQWWNPGDVVCVESTLYKITKSKRKDSTSDFQEVLTHSSNVIYNPHEDIGQFSAVCIPVQSMRPFGDQHTIYKLLFRIQIQPKHSAASNKSTDDAENEEICNRRNKSSNKLYGCELIILEKNVGCIADGDYETALQEFNSSSIKSFSPKKRTWETLPDNYIPLSMKFDVFHEFPTLKFRIVWTSMEIPASIDAKDLSNYGSFEDACHNKSNGNKQTALNGDAHSINHNNNCIKGNTLSAKTEKIQIVYNFLYSNNTRQQTEYTQQVKCPWCGLDCLRLYALLKHLKLCHARFNFTYQPAGNGARIDVTINDAYDGSYAGSPFDLAGPSGCSFARTCGPVRRTTVTNLLVCRPRRQKTCLDEFLVLDEDDLNNQRPYITGHNRLYHHTETCLPVHPKELDIDSEGESDPLWLRQKTIQMIDEFSDVNEGEKELMKLWNLHVMKHGYVGDCQLPLACEMFLDKNGYEIIRKNLYRNFIMHMSSLFDYGLVSPETVYKTIQKLQGMLSKYNEGLEMMSKKREAQLKYWLEVGIHKQDEQKLKSPQKLSGVLHSSTASSSGKLSKQEEGNKSTADGKLMHPPTKRSAATAVKRASLQGNSNSLEGSKLANGAGTSKGVAKKSALQDNDGKSSTSSNSGKERRSENILKRLSTNGVTDNKPNDKLASNRLSLDSKNQAVKRKLSIKDVPPQPAPKRSRTSDTANNNVVNSSSTTTTRSSLKDTKTAANNSNNTNNTNSNSTSQPKRLVTRRQSIAGTGDAKNTSSSTTTTTTAPTLRTRLSVPATKNDKR